MQELLAFFVALATTVLLIRFLLPLSIRLGFVDRPGGRKRHQRPIPTVGGVAMILGCVAAIELLFGMVPRAMAGGEAMPVVTALPFGLLLAVGLLIAFGLLDDKHNLSAKPRFMIQIVVALCLIFSGPGAVQSLGGLLFSGDIALGVLAVPFTVVAVVGCMNAVNMVDGVDGLAGGLVLIAVLAMMPLAVLSGSLQIMLACCLLAGALLGFLLFNARLPWAAMQPARIFMGDAGSMFLGFALAWCLVGLTQQQGAVLAPAAALWLVAVPLMDMTAVMLRRLLQRRSPLNADRRHLHHLLQRAGWSPSQTLGLMLAMAAVGAAVGLGATWHGVPDGVLFVGFLVTFSAYFTATHRAWQHLGRRDRRDDALLGLVSRPAIAPSPSSARAETT